MDRPFASRVKTAGAISLVEAREEAIAMHQVLSGMFDDKIDEIKKLSAELAKHEYAINTVTQAKAIMAEAEAFSANAVKENNEASETLKAAKLESRAIIHNARKGAQDAVNARAITLAQTEGDAQAILDLANAQGKEIVAVAHAVAGQVAEETEAAKVVLADYNAKISSANQSLSALNKTLASEKARLIKLFDK